jgi:hypothetical protein
MPEFDLKISFESFQLKGNYSGGGESSVGETPTGAGGTPALPRKLNSYIKSFPPISLNAGILIMAENMSSALL